MAFRLLFARTLTRQCFLERSRLLREKYSCIKLDGRFLNTKVLDKNANWNSQRIAHQNRRYKEKSVEAFEPKSSAEAIKDTSTKTRTEKPIDSSVITIPAEVNDNFNNISTDADVFGGTRPNSKEDEGDFAEEEYLNSSPKNKLSHIQYVRLIKQQLIAKQLEGAIDVLEKSMKQDRVRPNTYTYNLLISACAKAGYTRKAFSLFNKMRQRGLNVTGGTYTSLFNGCANAPTAVDGLNRANHLREIMLEKGVEPNLKNYNAMIKAYGRWGDVKSAYQLGDEMKEKKLNPTAETYNFLLQACASDTQFGFRHSLLTWHKMLKSGFKPDCHSFKSILRCVRDCGFGDIEAMEETLHHLLGENRVMPQILMKDQNAIDSPKLIVSGNEVRSDITTPTTAKNPFQLEKESVMKTKSTNVIRSNPFVVTRDDVLQEKCRNGHNSLEVKSESDSEAGLLIPNLLAPKPHLGSMLTLSEIKNPHERFLLLGGLNGFLDIMKRNVITPDIEIFTMLLEVIPPTNSAEKQVLTFIRRIGLKTDVDFFNVLIKKRSMRFEYEGAKEVLSMISTSGLHPDIVTYGVLALGCRTQEEARDLLQKMRKNDVRLNIQILGAMLRQGCVQRAFPYVCEIIQISLDEHIKPNDIFIRHLHNFYTRCARSIDARHPLTKTKTYKKQHAKFCDKLRLYYEEHGIAGLKLNDAIKVIEEGPYQQYKDAKIEGFEPEKNEALARKQKIRKYIKKMKISNLKGDETATDKPSQSIEPLQKSFVS